MPPRSFFPLASALVVLASGAASSAQTVLVSYTFSNQSSVAAALAPTSVATSVTAGSFAVSDGSFTSTHFTTGSPPGTPAVADAGSWDGTTPTKYFSFTVAPAAGYQLVLTGISFDYRQTPTGAVNFRIDVGSAVNVAAGTFVRDSSWYSVNPAFTPATLAGSTEIRIYGYGGGGGSFGIDQVSLSGTLSAIPEPSTYAAFAGGAALIGAAWWRRRRPPAVPTPVPAAPPKSG